MKNKDESVLCKKIPVGAVFQHYRNRNKYKIIGWGRHTESMELQVIYQALYFSEQFGASAVWIRPLKMFLEMVELEGRQVPRFRRLETPV